MKMIVVWDCVTLKKFYFSDIKSARHFIDTKVKGSYQLYDEEV